MSTNDRHLFFHLLLLWAMFAWCPILYLIHRWRPEHQLRQALIRGLVVGLPLAVVSGLLWTRSDVGDWVSPRYSTVLSMYVFIHAVLIGIFARNRQPSLAAFFGLVLVWVEASALIIVVAAWAFLKFGYL